MPRPSLLAPLLVLLVLAGCGRGADDAAPPAPAPSTAPADEPATKKRDLRAGLAGLHAGDDTDAAGRRTGRCFADALLTRLTPAELQQAGVVDEEYAAARDVPPLPPAVATAWVDAQLSCADFYAESARAQEAATKRAVDGAAYARCLRRTVPESAVRSALAEALAASLESPAVARLARAQARCADTATPR